MIVTTNSRFLSNPLAGQMEIISFLSFETIAQDFSPAFQSWLAVKEMSTFATFFTIIH